MKYKWWEKTVEYLFVIHVTKLGKFEYLSPFDGLEEQAGDTIISNKPESWILIEFKKDEKSISTEKRKFDNYEEAMEALGSRSSHHHFIYGDYNADEQRPVLKSRLYFSNASDKGQVSPSFTKSKNFPRLEDFLLINPNDPYNLDLEELLSSGIIFDEFLDYVKQFIKFKKGPDGPFDSGGLLIIVGISNKNKILQTISLRDFLIERNKNGGDDMEMMRASF